MIGRILLAVDESPDALAAARVAIELAGAVNARLRIVHVSADHLLDEALAAASNRPAAGERRVWSAVAMLTRVTALAEQSGLAPETSLLSGDVAPSILDDAETWHADLVVVGKSARAVTGQPYVGTQTRHILEFADQPVLVVPPDRR